jgi:hypothetical protein
MKSRIPWKTMTLTLLVLFPMIKSFSQAIKLMRYDEDYEYLRDSSKTFTNCIKFLPVTADQRSYLTFGGEIREEYGGKINEDWILGQGFNSSFLQC